jgi:hypothetical protein
MIFLFSVHQHDMISICVCPKILHHHKDLSLLLRARLLIFNMCNIITNLHGDVFTLMSSE